MNTFPSNVKDIEVQRLRLEKTWQPSPVQRLQQISSRLLHQAGQWLVKTLTEGDQLHIQAEATRQGTVWHVYDPVSGTDHMFSTEDALRVWLEQRYRH